MYVPHSKLCMARDGGRVANSILQKATTVSATPTNTARHLLHIFIHYGNRKNNNNYKKVVKEILIAKSE